MHAHETRADLVPLGLRWATVGKTRVAVEQVRTLESQSGVDLGVIGRHHL